MCNILYIYIFFFIRRNAQMFYEIIHVRITDNVNQIKKNNNNNKKHYSIRNIILLGYIYIIVHDNIHIICPNEILILNGKQIEKII